VSLLDRVRELDAKYRFMNAYAEEESHGKGLLSGYAVSVKDNVCVKGLESKAGSKILEGYIPPFDATVVVKSRAEGGIIIGKTTQDEFGFGTFWWEQRWSGVPDGRSRFPARSHIGEHRW